MKQCQQWCLMTQGATMQESTESVYMHKNHRIWYRLTGGIHNASFRYATLSIIVWSKSRRLSLAELCVRVGMQTCVLCISSSPWQIKKFTTSVQKNHIIFIFLWIIFLFVTYISFFFFFTLYIYIPIKKNVKYSKSLLIVSTLIKMWYRKTRRPDIRPENR